MKKLLIPALLLMFLLSACTIGPISISTKPAATTTTAAVTTAAVTTSSAPATITTAPITTRAPAATTAATTTTTTTPAVTKITTTEAPNQTILGTQFFEGAWLCHDVGVRIEVDPYSNIAFCKFNSSDPCYGTYMYDGHTLMANVYDPEGDANVTVSFDAAAGPGEADVPIYLTYKQDAHDFLGMKYGETYEYRRTDEMYFLYQEPSLYAAFEVEDYEGSHFVQIPYIYSDFQSDAIDEINSDLTDIMNEYSDFMATDNGTEQLNWISDIDQSDSAIQIRMLRNIYPSYGTDGTLQTWYYDIPTDTIYTLDEAIEQTQPDPDRMVEAVETQFPEYSVDWDEAELAGFYVYDTYTIDFYIDAPAEGEGADPWNTIFVVRYKLDSDEYMSWLFRDEFSNGVG